MRKLLSYAVIALVIAGVLLGAREFRLQSRETETVEILDQMVVERGDLRVTVSATGAVLPQRQVPLLFEAQGVVVEINVADGDQVRAGDVLARLDTTEAQATLDEALVALEVQRIAYDYLLSPPRPEDIAVAQAALDSALASMNAAASSGVSAQDSQIAALQGEIARNRLWQAQLQRDIAVNTPGYSPDIRGLLPDGGENLPPEVIEQANAALAGLLPSAPGVDPASFEAGLEQAQYGIEIADSNYNATLGRSGDTAGYSSAQAAAIAAQVALDRLVSGASERDLELAEIGLRQAELAVETAQLNLDRATLVAPFDGVVVQNRLVVGELPPAQTPALLLLDLSGFFVDIAIDETDVVDLALDQPVELDFDALPDTLLSGRVTRINQTPTVVGQLVSYPVRVALDSTDQPVRVGMTATATVIVNELNGVLTLPNRFIRLDRLTGSAFVSVQAVDGTFSEVQVELGLRNELESEIVSGLTEGTRVVLLPRGTFDPIGDF